MLIIPVRILNPDTVSIVSGFQMPVFFVKFMVDACKKKRPARGP